MPPSFSWSVEFMAAAPTCAGVAERAFACSGGPGPLLGDGLPCWGGHSCGALVCQPCAAVQAPCVGSRSTWIPPAQHFPPPIAGWLRVHSMWHWRRAAGNVPWAAAGRWVRRECCWRPEAFSSAAASSLIGSCANDGGRHSRGAVVGAVAAFLPSRRRLWEVWVFQNCACVHVFTCSTCI